MDRPEDGGAASGGEHLSDEEAVLTALGEPAPARVADHLAACAACRDEVDRYARTATAARSTERVAPVPVPAGTWEAVARETGVRSHPQRPVPAPVPDAVLPPQPRPLPAARPARWLALAAALLVGAGAGALGVRAWDRGAVDPVAVPPPAPLVASAVLDPLDSDGTGIADVHEVDGHHQLVVRVSGVAPAADGVLEAWLLDADGGLIALGPLVGEEFTAVLPADVDLERFSTVDVSREPLDGDPGHSSDSVLRGQLSPRAESA
ncbi:anti-sigma factor domain-containing protein [Kineococcus terrestris]|uniref:anti-sigma factor domain-containing protein n=1 Tax=Kineococcus terrestris TaxID=2044856 RepID=UPI0034DB36B4